MNRFTPLFLAIVLAGVPSAALPSPPASPHEFTAEERQWWAVQPLADPLPPSAGDGWALNPIDHFLARRLDQAGLAPSPEADRLELLRRATFDLHGLPPSPAQTEAFLADDRPDAWEHLIEDLLASPRYGERWAQHWLDVVRWAESDGYRQDAFRPQAWPYRDYVIDSFNRDKPYDQFVREQLAGDEIAPHDPDVLIATAYLRNGIYEYNQRNVTMHWDLIVSELTRVTSEAFLGLGIGCAQCHDHKFDPILQEDYFALQAFLAPVRWRYDLPLASPAAQRDHAERLAAWNEATAGIREAIDAILEPKITRQMRSALEKFPDDIQAMFAKAPVDRSPYEQQLVELADIQLRYERERFNEDKSLSDDEKSRLADLRTRLAEFENLKPQPLPEAFAASDIGPVAPVTWLQTRAGRYEVEPHFLTLLGLPRPEIRPTGHSTGRRLALANWIAQPDNPLSTRVIVNRIWQHHFGAGLVLTSNDFGTLGEPPSHPELLDWLTRRFLEGAWKIKPLHRLIMTSAAYRQTARSEPSPEALLPDPENRLLWRFSPRRLDAEQIRDAMLAVSGELRNQVGGPSVDGASPRRSIYVKKIRNTPDPILDGFDSPMGFESAPQRIATTTPTQSLLLVNGDWPRERAARFATSLLEAHPQSIRTGAFSPALVAEAWRRAFGREPDPAESRDALAFLHSHVAGAASSRPDPYPGESGFRPIRQAFGKGSGVDLGPSALWLQPGSRFQQAEHASPPPLGDAFTFEAVASLDNIYPDASVNTLLSRWNGDQRAPGWTFGVTSEKSKYQPRNFILQLVGQDFQHNTVYEVVASGLRFPLFTPVYFAAAISTAPAAGDATSATVTFYLQDLADPDATLQTRTLSHPVVQPIQSPGIPFLLSGRALSSGHLWDGQLARLRVSAGLLPAEALLVSRSPSSSTGSPPLIDWSFDESTGASPAPGLTFREPGSNPAASLSDDSPVLDALADFCHALLNANEFLYLH